MNALKRVAACALFVFLIPACATLFLTQEDISKVQQGMTEKEVVQKIGKPTDINRSRTANGTRAQFVYSNYGGQYQSAYIYFRNGGVTSVQY